MSRSPDTSILLHRRFDDFDELAVAARHWDLDLMQLDCGGFQGEAFQMVSGQVLLSEGRFGRTLRQQGAAPRGMRTFVVPAKPTVRFKWRRRDVGPNDLLVFPRSGELHAISRSDFHVFTLSLSESLLHEIAALADVPDLWKALRREHVPCRALLVNQVRRRLFRICYAAKQQPQLSGHLASVCELQSEIPLLLVRAISAASTSAEAITSRKRDGAIRRAEEFITHHQDWPLTLRDVCAAAQVSERTLQYGFLEHFGITPKAYLKAVRLNGVRKDLKVVDRREAKISEIANHWGFWHMGQFAADYRKKFGELPSQTCQR